MLGVVLSDNAVCDFLRHLPLGVVGGAVGLAHIEQVHELSICAAPEHHRGMLAAFNIGIPRIMFLQNP